MIHANRACGFSRRTLLRLEALGLGGSGLAAAPDRGLAAGCKEAPGDDRP